jgi:hypothetical protein
VRDPPAIAAREGGRRTGKSVVLSRDLAVGLALGIVAVLWRLPWLLTPFLPNVDEYSSVETALLMLQRHEFIPFLLGQNYMGTVTEGLMAAVISIAGLNYWTIRLPGVVLFAGSIFLFYLGFRRFRPIGSSAAAALLIALGNSVVLYFSARTLPDYDAAWLVLAALMCVALSSDEHLTFWRMAGLTLLSAVAIYLYQLLAIFVFVAWLFVGYRTQILQKTLVGMWHHRRRLFAGLALLLAGFLAVSPSVYLKLQRGLWIRVSTDVYLLWGGVVLLVLGVLTLISTITFERRLLLMVGSAAVAIALALTPAWLCESRWQKFYDVNHLATHITPYAFKPIQELRNQVYLLVDDVVPFLFEGRVSLFGTILGTIPNHRFGFADLLADLVFFGSLAAGVIIAVRSKGASHAAEWLYLLPALALVITLLPSWRLYGPLSCRYLLFCLPAVWLTIGRIFDDSNLWRQLLGGVAVFGFLGYCFVDNLKEIPKDKAPFDVAAARLVLETNRPKFLVANREIIRFANSQFGNEFRCSQADEPKYPGLFIEPEVVRHSSCVGVYMPDSELLTNVFGDELPNYEVVTETGGWQIYRRKAIDNKAGTADYIDR